MPIAINDILKASATLSAAIKRPTPLQACERLSQKYNAKIYLKREDLQKVRSFKIRGAYNKIATLTAEEKVRGVVCASAGNHAQGVAYSCHSLKIAGQIFMPQGTPNQKVHKVKHFGQEYIDVRLVGRNFDEAKAESERYCHEHGAVYVHPFDDPKTIAGQGTIAKEVYDHAGFHPDIIIVSVGGGGMAAGVSVYSKGVSPQTQVIGAEGALQASMRASLDAGEVRTLEHIDSFLEGTAVRTPGQKAFMLCREYLDDVVVVEDGHVCTELIDLYQHEGIIAEPSGAIPLAALETLKHEIEGKHVVCVVCGGNNDILRYPDIMERSLVWRGLKHYFIINFSQRPGQLKQLVNEVLSEDEDIVLFEYIKRNNREKGPALVGIELSCRDDLEGLLGRFDEQQLDYQVVDPGDKYLSMLLF